MQKGLRELTFDTSSGMTNIMSSEKYQDMNAATVTRRVCFFQLP